MIRLKELREERHWTMRDAAAFLKKSYTTYVNHEKGYREPNSEDLALYARAYGVSIDYLVGRSETRTPATDSPSDLSDKDIMFALFHGADVPITDEMYKEVLRYRDFVIQREKDKLKKE